MSNVTFHSTTHAVRRLPFYSYLLNYMTITHTLQYYFKTWTGTQVGYPPNGGGGGLGGKQILPRPLILFITPHANATLLTRLNLSRIDVSNMTIENLVTNGIGGAAVSIGQCTTFSSSSVPTNCSNSLVQIHDVAVTNVTGTTKSTDVASLQCSAVKPCYNIELDDINLRIASTATYAAEYLCAEVEDTIGFNCTGSACVDSSATGEC